MDDGSSDGGEGFAVVLSNCGEPVVVTDHERLEPAHHQLLVGGLFCGGVDADVVDHNASILRQDERRVTRCHKSVMPTNHCNNII